MGIIISQSYTIAFVASVLLLFVVIAKFKTQVSQYYILYYFGIALSNLGYMQIASANDVKTALYANQVVYLGASFVPYFMICCMADVCKTVIKRWIGFCFFIYGAFVFFLTSTIGIFDWYYEDVSLATNKYGLSFLVKQYGPLHLVYPLYLLIVIIMALAIIVNSYRTKRDVSHFSSILLFLICACGVITYAIEKLSGTNIELVPFSYVVEEIVLLILINRISTYNISSITTDSMVESLEHGFFLYDSNGKYLGSDAAAKKWFPELLDLQVDAYIKNASTPFLCQIEKWRSDVNDQDEVLIKSRNATIAAKHSELKRTSKKIINIVYLRDDTKHQEYTKLVEKYNENLEREVNEKAKKLYKVQNDIIVSMASIVENRDNNTGGHIARTSDVVKIFVDYLLKENLFPQMDRRMAENIIKAAPLHDFGKIGIPDVILNKPGKFTPEEYEQMKEHSAKGALIVARILQHVQDEDFKTIAVNVAHYHHEKWDGTGYPTHISGADIPFEARVMALADVFDALVSKRVYKEKFTYDKAFSIIEESCGTHFEPNLCRAFIKCRPKLEALYNSYTD